jgi:Predicted membrane protein (DUF2339)/Protein of unknown function (DUF3999)
VPDILIPILVILGVTPILAIVALVWVARLSRRLDSLEHELRWREARVRREAESRDRQATSGAAPPVPASAAPQTARGAGPSPPPGPAVPPPLPSAPGRPAPAGAPAATPPGLEERIGTRWLNVAGIITLLFGVAFFLKYAYDNAWIGPRGRVAIGVAAGLAALLLGDRTRRLGHRVFSQGVTGGGIAALYLSFFFSFRLYHLIEIVPAFVLMAAVTAGGVGLALAQDSLAVALLSFLGGYLTPVLLSTGRDAGGFLFSYLAVLALGALGAAYARRWRALDLMAFAGTWLLYAGWYASYYRLERLSVALLGAAGFFLIFLVLPYVRTLVRGVVAGPDDHLLALANAVVTFGFLYRMIHPIEPRALGFVALALAAIYLLLGSIARARLAQDTGLLIALHGFSIAFLTLAIPLEMGLHGITLAWAAEGVVMFHLGLRYRARLTRLAGLAILCLAVARLLLRHVPLHAHPFRLFLNANFGTWAFVVAAIFIAAAMARRHADRLQTVEQAWPSWIPVAGIALLLAALHMETRLYGRLWGWSPQGICGTTMLLWVLAPLAVMVVGLALSDRIITGCGVVLTALAVVPFLGVVALLGSSAHPLLGSFAFWMGVLAVAGCVAVGRLGGGLTLLGQGTIGLDRALTSLGAALLLILLTAEVHGHFRLQPGTPEAMAGNGLRAMLSVSVLWALYASVLMAIGFRRSDRFSRYAATALFGLTLVKLFLVDLWELRAVYRIVSFVILGLLLVVASYVYSRFRARLAVSILLLALAPGMGGTARAEFQADRWESMRPIDLPVDAAARGGGFAALALDDAVLAGARPDLADLRVVGRDGLEVPCVVRTRAGGRSTEMVPVKLLNRTERAGGAISIDVAFAARVTRNRLEVETTGTGFRRRVRVEGSDDGHGWGLLVDHAWIHDIPAAAGFPAVRRALVVLPDNDFRRVRVTVFPTPGDRGRLGIRTVRALHEIVRPAETVPLRVAGVRTDRDPQRQTTTLGIDFGFRNARPLSLQFDFEDEAFRRSYTIEGRNTETTLLENGASRDGDGVTREVETPWRILTSGTFFRLPAGRAGEEAIDQTSVALPDAPDRYLRVVIRDGDDRPLRLRDVTARMLTRRVIFPVRPGGDYVLYYGNSGATPPVYDLPALLPEPQTRALLEARLEAPRANPLHRPAEPPWSERYPWLLWVVLPLAVAMLAALIYRNLKGLPAGTT